LKLKIGNITKTNLIEKGFSTLSLEYKFTSAIRKYFKSVEFDLILYPTPPITFLKAVEYVKKRDKAFAYLLLKDIFPQNAVDLGILINKGWKKHILNYFIKKEKKLYSISDVIGCMSNANVEYIKTNYQNIEYKEIEVCANSLKIRPIIMLDRDSIRVKYNLPLNKIILIYGGNIGKPQGVDFIIECIIKNELNSETFILVIGDGTEYNKLNKFYKDIKPLNSSLINALPKNEYDLLVSCSDIGLIFLDYRFTIPNFPSRMLSYMKSSKPVLACTDLSTDIGEIIVDNKFGYWCKSNNSTEFDSILNSKLELNEIHEFGVNARNYFEQNYSVDLNYITIMNHLKS